MISCIAKHFLFFHQGEKGSEGSKGLQVNKVHQMLFKFWRNAHQKKLIVQWSACYSINVERLLALKIIIIKSDLCLFWSFQENGDTINNFWTLSHHLIDLTVFSVCVSVCVCVFFYNNKYIIILCNCFLTLIKGNTGLPGLTGAPGLEVWTSCFRKPFMLTSYDLTKIETTLKSLYFGVIEFLRTLSAWLTSSLEALL